MFYILCGCVENRKSAVTALGEQWAIQYGAPILYNYEKTTEDLLNRLILNANYAIFILDGDPLINNVFMKYKMMGKHGSVIKI